MMIEIFYPRELKKIIKDLHEKNDLNESVSKKIITQIYFMGALWLFLIICAFYFKNENLIYVVISLLLVFPVIIKFFLWDNYRYMAAYILGELREAVIIEKYTRPSNAGSLWHFTAKDKETSEIIKFGPFTGYLSSEAPKAGQEIKYMITKNKMYKAMPLKKEIMSKYCLSKTIFNLGV